MFALLGLDLVVLLALQWAPFDPPAGSTIAQNLAGGISLLLNLAGYFFALLLHFEKVPILFYVTIFAVTYFEFVFLAMAFIWIRGLIKKPSPPATT